MRRGTNNKEYHDLCWCLDFVDRILSIGGMEFEFAEYYFERVVQVSGNPQLELAVKEIRRYTGCAIRAS